MASIGGGGLLTSSVEWYEGGLSSSSVRVSDEEESLRSTDIEKIEGFRSWVRRLYILRVRQWVRSNSKLERQSRAFFKHFQRNWMSGANIFWMLDFWPFRMSEIQVMVSLRTHRRACRSRLFRPNPDITGPSSFGIFFRPHLELDFIAVVQPIN